MRYCFLAILGFLARFPGLQGQLVWDDAYLAHDNPFIKSPLLALEVFRHYLFLDSLSAHYRPVQNLSLMVDYFFWNTDPYGFHLTNILLHLASGLLLYRLLTLLFRNGAGIWNGGSNRVGIEVACFLAAAIWMVHPVHSAAIDYISGRADSLAFVFSVGAWLLFLRGQRVQSRWLKSAVYLLAALCALVALCSRETALIWLFLFLIHTVVFARQLSGKTKIAATICCAVLVGTYALLHSLPQARLETRADENWPAPVRAILMLRALGDYGRLMVWPANLHMERTIFDPAVYRGRAGWRSAAGIEYLSILGLLVLAGFFYGCAKRGAGQRTRIIGAIWFFIAYLPTSNIVQLNATVAEHWLYLPSVGFLIFLIGCAIDLPRKFTRPLVATAAVAIVALTVRSAYRSSDWRDDEVFYKRTLAAGGGSTRVATNLALIYTGRGDYAEAGKMFRRILELYPEYPTARNNLADVLSREGKNAEAEQLFAKSASAATKMRTEYPRTWIAAVNLAHMRSKAHDDAGAIAVLEQARADYPDVWEIISFESELLRRDEGPKTALRLVESYVRDNWWHQGACLAEGKLYMEDNKLENALRALHRAAMLDVHDAETLNLIARICIAQNRWADACAAQERAVARQPDRPSEYFLLAAILEKMGRKEDVRATLAKASRLRAMAVAQPSLATVIN